MEFLDQKERVISMELTPYGKYLLSIGKFKPEMYAFFDDDIIYDYEFGGVGDELQNEIEPRIQENTPRFVAQGFYRGAETAVFSSAPNIEDNLMPGAIPLRANTRSPVRIQETPDATQIFQNPLGTSAFNSQNMPAWDINFLKAELGDVAMVATGSTISTQTIFIPQLNCEVQYKVNKFEANIEDSQSEEDPLNLNVEAGDSEIYDETIFFTDGSRIEYEEDFVLLKIEEANTAFLKENFDIEIYETTNVGGSSAFASSGDEALKKLKFADPGADPTPEDVEYYFDILFDSDIDEQTYCSLVKDNKVKNIYSDKTFTCPDVVGDAGAALNVYNTDENEPEEVC